MIFHLSVASRGGKSEVGHEAEKEGCQLKVVCDQVGHGAPRNAASCPGSWTAYGDHRGNTACFRVCQGGKDKRCISFSPPIPCLKLVTVFPEVNFG